MIENLCPPAIIFILYVFVQIVLDTLKGLYNTALLKFVTGIVFTFILQFLCNIGLTFISWIFIFIPFFLMTIIIGMLILTLGINPSTGLSIRTNGNKNDNRYKKNNRYDLNNYLDEGEDDFMYGIQDVRKDFDNLMNEKNVSTSTQSKIKRNHEKSNGSIHTNNKNQNLTPAELQKDLTKEDFN